MLLEDEALVQAVIDDYRTAPIPESERALLAYIEKLNLDGASVNQGDIDRLHDHGWSDEAIYDAVMVCGLFNFYNRWIDGTGVHEMTDEEHKASGARIARNGYL